MSITPAIKIYYKFGSPDTNDGLTPLTPVGTWNGVRNVIANLGLDYYCPVEVVFMSDVYEDIVIDRPMKLTGGKWYGSFSTNPLITAESSYLEIDGMKIESFPLGEIMILDDLMPGMGITDIDVVGVESSVDVFNFVIGNPVENTFESFQVMCYRAIVAQEALPGVNKIKVNGSLNEHWTVGRMITFQMDAGNPSVYPYRTDIIQALFFDGVNTEITLSEPLPYRVNGGTIVFLQVLTVDGSLFNHPHYKGEIGIEETWVRFLKPLLVVNSDTSVIIHDSMIAPKSVVWNGGLLSKIEIDRCIFGAGILPMMTPFFVVPKAFVPPIAVRNSFLTGTILQTMTCQNFPNDRRFPVSDMFLEGEGGVRNNIIVFDDWEKMNYHFSQAVVDFMISKLGFHVFSTIRSSPPIPLFFRENCWFGKYIDLTETGNVLMAFKFDKHLDKGKFPVSGVVDTGKDLCPIESLTPDFEPALSQIKSYIIGRKIKIF